MGGISACVKRYVCDAWGSARLLVQLAQDDDGDVEIRDLALALASDLTDERQIAAKIQSWVRGHIAYRTEPSETFQSPRVTLAVRAGDCDDHARLVRALARQAGLQARLVFLTMAGDPFHAVTQIRASNDWLWAETTEERALGQVPDPRLT